MKTDKELAIIALRYIEKSYNYEQLMYGDDLYHATEEEKETCGNFWEEAGEIGTKAFRDKINAMGKEPEPTNTTDAMKDTINKMFAEPINEVQVAFEDVVSIRSILTLGKLDKGMLDNVLDPLQSAINALKEKLPTPQG